MPKSAAGAAGQALTGNLQNEHREALRRAAWLGTLILPFFLGLDLLMVFSLYPQTPVLWVVLLRIAATGSALQAFLIARNRRLSYRAALIAHVCCIAALSLAVALYSAWFGGPASNYIQGLTIVVLVRSTVVPERFSLAIRYVALMMLTYPLVMLIAAALSPHPEWFTSRELAMFVTNYVLVGASMLGGAGASHLVWVARQQVFEARRLGRYRLEAPIGRGGQNEVWLAWDTTGERQVALKVLRSDATAEALALFRREANIARSLEDPHAVRIFDFGASEDGIHYLAMEFLDGADLSLLLRSHGPLAAARVVHFALQACAPLQEAHDKGLVHRDVKPANLMALRTEGAQDTLKLLDFGIARALESGALETRAGVIRGTPAYLAPEVCRGQSATAAADIYGLGATLYHLLAGVPPFEGSDVAVLAQKLTGAPKPLREWNASIPEDLAAATMRCLDAEPANRFVSMSALRDALLACDCATRWSSHDAEFAWNQHLQVRGVTAAETVV